MAETEAAICLLGAALESCAPGAVTWLFDKPVSNSGRLKTMMAAIAEEAGWHWDIQLITRVDETVSSTGGIAVSSDGWILDRAARWCNVTELVIARAEALERVIDLR